MANFAGHASNSPAIDDARPSHTTPFPSPGPRRISSFCPVFPAAPRSYRVSCEIRIAFFAVTCIRRNVMAAKKRSGRKTLARKTAGRKSSRKYGTAASKRVESAMRRRRRATLKSERGGKGGTVKSRKQAIAIGLRGAKERRQSSEEARLSVTLRSARRPAPRCGANGVPEPRWPSAAAPASVCLAAPRAT